MGKIGRRIVKSLGYSAEPNLDGQRVHLHVREQRIGNVDLETGTLPLDAGTTGNDDGRVTYLPSRASSPPRWTAFAPLS
jgi:hypothetical protein